MTRFIALICVLAVSACSNLGMRGPAAPDTPAVDGPMRPHSRPVGLGRSVPKNARTAEQFDVTTAQERAEAAKAPPVAAERALGSTVASLGDPAQPGFWIKTPLANSQGKGRVSYPAKGTSVQVDVYPLEGEASAGSRLSLAAFRVLEAPLTDLPEVDVFLGQ